MDVYEPSWTEAQVVVVPSCCSSAYPDLGVYMLAKQIKACKENCRGILWCWTFLLSSDLWTDLVDLVAPGNRGPGGLG